MILFLKREFTTSEVPKERFCGYFVSYILLFSIHEKFRRTEQLFLKILLLYHLIRRDTGPYSGWGFPGLLTDGGIFFLSKVCHTYPTKMKLGTVIRCLKKTQKICESRDTPSICADISIFSSEISKFCYIRKYKYRLHFGT